MLLLARITTGIFGGVIGSVVLAIATDLFAPQVRGRVMGFIQTAFAASQVLGLPVGLYLSNRWNWHAPFLVMVVFGIVGGLVIAWRMKPVADHLAVGEERNAFTHLLHTVADPRYLLAFATTALLTTGGYMLMPFGSAFTVNNLGISLASLPMIYLITGICTIFTGPMIGKAADAIGKLRVFIAGSAITITMVLYLHTSWNDVLYHRRDHKRDPVRWHLFADHSLPGARDFRSRTHPTGFVQRCSASTQQLSGALASLIAGHIVTFGADGKLQHFPIVGYVVIGSTLISGVAVWQIQRDLRKRASQPGQTNADP